MAGNTTTSSTTNQTFYTGVVPIVVGVLNPVNSPQTVWDAGVGMSYASITTVVAGSPASFTIVLEGTYDGTNWTILATTTNVAGETQFGTGLIPFTNLRARCTAVSGGSSPTVSVVATASQTPFTNTQGGTSPTTNISGGSVSPITILNAATTTTTGTVADFSASHHAGCFQIVASAGTTAGAVTFLGSVDGTTFTILTTATLLGTSGGNSLAGGVLTFTAAGSALVSQAGNAASALRYLRADVTTNFVGGSVTVKAQAA